MLGGSAAAEGKPDPKVLRALTELVRDRSTRVRRDAWIRVAEGPAEDQIAGATGRNTEGEKLRIVAIMALGAFGEASASSVPDLVDARSRTTIPVVRQFAVRALGSVGPGAEKAVPDLIELLQSKRQASTPRRRGPGTTGEPPGRSRNGTRQDRPQGAAPPFLPSSGP